MAYEKYIKSPFMVPVLMLATIVLAVLVAYSDPMRQFEQKIVDQLFELRGPLSVEDSPIILVSISQQADEEIPFKYPWPTRVYAKLIENLNKAGAKAIGIDVIFDKPDNYDSANDRLFAAALKKYGNVVLAGKVFTNRRLRGAGTASKGISLVQPIPLLSESNPNAVGLVSNVEDVDEGVRRYLLFQEFNRQRYLPMGLELLRLYHGWEDPAMEEEGSSFRYGTYRIPRYNANTMAINYFGEPGMFPTYSFETVIDDSTVLLTSEDDDFQINTFTDPDFGLLQQDVFKNKIVLVGATMAELHDYHATPFATSGTRPGYEIHAHAMQTLLTGRYIHYMPAWINLLLLILFSTLVVAFTRKASAVWGIVAFTVLIISAICITIYGFLEFGYVIDLTGSVAALGIGYIATNSYEYMVEQREKRRIRSMFSSYVSPELVDRMIASGQEPQLGGDEVFITAFFSDIEAFSTFSEQLEPRDLVELINEYLTAMTDIITGEGGTLDKYIGDAIVAFFGAPVSLEAHAYQACVASQLMRRRLAELRAKWKSEGDRWPQTVRYMRNRIGINTGIMVTGNMGSARRFNYTVMGDNANLAARCESGAKSFGVCTMVTEATMLEAERFGDRCVFRYLDRIVVKGRTEAVNVYEIMGLNEDLTARDWRCKELFEQGIECYRRQDWERAIELFGQSMEFESNQIGPEDPTAQISPSSVYLDRCRRMQNDPPGKDWNGVYVMETK
jgi:adenylate cyclase